MQRIRGICGICAVIQLAFGLIDYPYVPSYYQPRDTCRDGLSARRAPWSVELHVMCIFCTYVYIEGVDFTPTPSGGSSVSFPQNSTVTELCVDVILDDVACENPEDFRIRLISLNPAISTVCSTEAIVTIRDSTSKTV